MNKTAIVSTGLAVCMFGHATEGLFHGKSPSEIHLITSVTLTTSTGTVSSVTYHPNAIHDAEYLAAPDSAALKNSGLTQRSTDT